MNRSNAAATMRYRIGIPRSGMGMPRSGTGTASITISATHRAPRMLEREQVTLRRLGAQFLHQEIEEPRRGSLDHVADIAGRVGDVRVLDVTSCVAGRRADRTPREIHPRVESRVVDVQLRHCGSRQYGVALMPPGVFERLSKCGRVPDQNDTAAAKACCVA